MTVIMPLFCSLHISSGEVTELLDGEDGDPSAQYTVDYGDEGCFEVDHLLEDFQKGDLKFHC